MNHQLVELLLECGLTESEVVVYMSLSESPTQTIWGLVARTGLSKSTVYRSWERLLSLKMVQKTSDGLVARSLSSFVSVLEGSRKKLGKAISKLRQLAPYLHLPPESVSTLEVLHTADQIADAYLSMADRDFDLNFDFGDFEGFIPLVGGLATSSQYQLRRMKHSQSRAICTTHGPFTRYYASQNQQDEFRNRVDVLPVKPDKKFTVFSDRSPYVLVVDHDDLEYPSGILIQSQTLANFQRDMFEHFSQLLGK